MGVGFDSDEVSAPLQDPVVMDLNHILLFIACVSPLVLLAQAWRRGGLNRAWRLAAFAVLAVTGVSWLLEPDTAGFVGGGPNTTAFEVANTIDDPLYYTRRTGNFTYSGAVANGSYNLRLLFKTLRWRCWSSGARTPSRSPRSAPAPMLRWVPSTTGSTARTTSSG